MKDCPYLPESSGNFELFVMLPWNSYEFLPISSMGLKVGHFKAKGINIGGIKLQLSVIFFV